MEDIAKKVLVEVSSGLIIKFILYVVTLLLGIKLEYIGLALGIVLLVAGFVLLLLWRWRCSQDRTEAGVMSFLVAVLTVVVAVFLAFSFADDCVKVDITDYNLPNENQLFKLKYKSHDKKVRTLNW